MIRRLYVHNFRCLENFELRLEGLHSVLLVGKNGSGKSTVSLALEVFQRIARGSNRVRDFIQPKDLTQGRTGVPVRFEMEAQLKDREYKYAIALEFPPGFKELRVLEEELHIDGKPIFIRRLADVHLVRPGDHSADFKIDWHMVALPIIQTAPEEMLGSFKQWLASILILRPIPALISGDSSRETSEMDPHVRDLGSWFSGIQNYTTAYLTLIENLKLQMPDFDGFKNKRFTDESKSLFVEFANEQGSLPVPFQDLSDGEKCMVIGALVIAANQAYGPLLCFWDEPDNHLSLDEVGHFMASLRKVFQSGGQLIATSHNPEAIRQFADENTLFLFRKSHLEPTVVRALSELDVAGDPIGALIRGDIEP
jgi:predicted ATPase